MNKIHFIKQHDGMQCGAACLAMIVNSYGVKCSLEYVSQMLHIGKNGVSMFAITEAANEIGFNCQGQLYTVEQLKEAQMPCILHWNQNHFVVLFKISKKEVFCIADPGKGLLKLTFEDFCRHWISTEQQGTRGTVLLLTPTEKLKNFHIDKYHSN